MCYAALCAEGPTGIVLSGTNINTGALSKNVFDSKRTDSKRTDSIGTGIDAQKIAQMKEAGVEATDEDVQLDEWPPIASAQGGAEVVIHPVTRQGSQGTAIRQAIEQDGLITISNFADIAECAALEKKEKSLCGTVKDMAQLVNGKFQVAFAK